MIYYIAVCLPEVKNVIMNGIKFDENKQILLVESKYVPSDMRALYSAGDEIVLIYKGNRLVAKAIAPNNKDGYQFKSLFMSPPYSKNFDSTYLVVVGSEFTFIQRPITNADNIHL